MIKWLVDHLGKGNKYIAILFVGIFFFVGAMFTAGFIVSFWQLKVGRYMAKHHFELWKKNKMSMFSRSIKHKYEVYKQMTSLNDPIVDELSGKGEKYWKYGFLFWFIVFLLVAFIIHTFGAE
ncbi:MAG: hypothetical protein ACFFC7_32670 [Candidatus Hermodarchaeota archaeon]